MPSYCGDKTKAIYTRMTVSSQFPIEHGDAILASLLAEAPFPLDSLS